MDERSHGVGAERGEHQGLGQRMCGYRPQQHPVRRVAVVRPVGDQHAGAKSLQPSRQEVDEAQRGGIDPVRIVDHQQQRGPLGQLGDMECQSSQQLECRLLAVLVGHQLGFFQQGARAMPRVAALQVVAAHRTNGYPGLEGSLGCDVQQPGLADPRHSLDHQQPAA